MIIDTIEIEERAISFLKDINADGGFFEHRILVVSRHINQKYIKFFGLFTNNKDFLLRSFDLFLWAHLTDMTLDAYASGEFNPWEIPKAVFCAFKLYSSYLTWVYSEYGESAVNTFNKLYNRQMIYQVLEKQWEMPSEYSTRYYDLKRVFEKEIVLLFPVLLLQNKGRKDRFKPGLILSFAKVFYSYLLISDDLNDLGWDIKGKAQSHVTALFFKKYGMMPTLKSDFRELFEEVMKELETLDAKIDSFCCVMNMDRTACVGDILYKISYQDWYQKIQTVILSINS